jgi:hypothetical protein
VAAGFAATARVIAGGVPAGLAFGVAGSVLLVEGLAAGWIAGLLRRGELLVGAEGLFVRAGWRRASIRYRDIAEVTSAPRGIVVSLHAGGTRELLLADAAQIDTVLDAIRAALGSGASGSPEREGLAALARRGRSLSAWHADLQRVLPSSARYRAAQLTAADLGAVIDDARQPAERRLAAAVALSAADAEEVARRAHAAAALCADPWLADALRCAGEGVLVQSLDGGPVTPPDENRHPSAPPLPPVCDRRGSARPRGGRGRSAARPRRTD